MSVQIVPAAERHLPQIAAIERACFSHPWSEDMLRDTLRNDAAVMAAAEGPAGDVLGYAGLQTVLDEGYIGNIAVRPDCRRQGVGDALLSALVRFGRERLSFLTLEVRSSNAPAIALYKKHGFHPVGRRRNYYDNPTEDAILMTLEFKNGTETN